MTLEDALKTSLHLCNQYWLEEHLVEDHQNRNKPDKNHTEELFEEAWTTFSKETFMHSVNLVESRLRD